MIACAVWACWALAPQRVTVRFGAISVQSALERISRLSGLTLTAQQPLDQDLIYMRVKDADPHRLMAAIAKTLDAKWLPKGDGYALAIDNVAVRKREVEQREAAAETWRGSLAYLRRRLAAEPAVYDQNAADSQRLHAQQAAKQRHDAEERQDFGTMFRFDHSAEETPAWRIGAHLVLMLDEAEVLKMPFRARQVWAENPTQMQSPMPLGSEELLAAYRQELAVFKPGAQVGRVKLEIERWEDGGSFTATLIGQGPDGKPIDQASLRLANDIDILSKLGGHSFVPPRPRENEKPIELPEAAKEQLALLNVRPTASAALRAKWRELLCDPLRYEPLRLLAGDEFVQAAEAEDIELVGTPEEQTVLRFVTAGGQTPSQFFARTQAAWKDDADGWRIARPADPIHRLSRELARNILTAAVARGGLSVDDAASWAGPDPYEFPFIDWLGDDLGALFPSSGQISTLRTTADGEALRLWDALAPDRTALRNGSVLQISGLAPEAQQKIAEFVYWYDVFGGGDPTDLFPTGARDGTVSLTVTQEPVFSAWASNGPEPIVPSVFDAKVFGESLVSGDRFSKTPAQTFLSMDRFRMGVLRTYTLHFTIVPGPRSFTIELSESMMPPDSEPLEQLPSAVMAAVESARAAARVHPVTKPETSSPPPS